MPRRLTGGVIAAPLLAALACCDGGVNSSPIDPPSGSFPLGMIRGTVGDPIGTEFTTMGAHAPVRLEVSASEYRARPPRRSQAGSSAIPRRGVRGAEDVQRPCAQPGRMGWQLEQLVLEGNTAPRERRFPCVHEATGGQLPDALPCTHGERRKQFRHAAILRASTWGGLSDDPAASRDPRCAVWTARAGRAAGNAKPRYFAPRDVH